jgi:sec-independent protein translocase protein TatA
MFGIGIEELIVILVILLLLTGGKKLPELTKGLAESVKEIRKGFKDELEPDDESKPAKAKKAKITSKKKQSKKADLS